MALVREIGFAQAYSFKYSPRPGTPAAAARKQIAEGVKDERLAELQALLREQADAFSKRCIGQEMDVLFQYRGRHEGQLVGRSPYLQSVHARAPETLLGRLSRVRMTGTKTNSLAGELLGAVAH